jgi:hypothetical protein
MCNKTALTTIIWNVYCKNEIHNQNYSAAIFSTFLHKNFEKYISIHKQLSRSQNYLGVLSRFCHEKL